MLFIVTPNDIVAALSMLADVIGEGLVGIGLGWATHRNWIYRRACILIGLQIRSASFF